MIRQVIDYIHDNSFELKFDHHYIDVLNYTVIHYMEDDKISLSYKEGTILIKGKHLSVIKLMEDEILIKGEFSNIEVRRNNE